MTAERDDAWPEPAGALYERLPRADGASGTITFSLLLGPRRETSVHWAYRDGSPVGGGTGAAPGADLTLSVARADALQLFGGEVEPSVSFMRGKLKAAGDGALLLAFLRSTTDPAFAAWRDGMAAAMPGLSDRDG